MNRNNLIIMYLFMGSVTHAQSVAEYNLEINQDVEVTTDLDQEVVVEYLDEWFGHGNTDIITYSEASIPAKEDRETLVDNFEEDEDLQPLYEGGAWNKIADNVRFLTNHMTVVTGRFNYVAAAGGNVGFGYAMAHPMPEVAAEPKLHMKNPFKFRGDYIGPETYSVSIPPAMLTALMQWVLMAKLIISVTSVMASYSIARWVFND